MEIFGIAGWSGSGKTTLLTRLIPVLTGRGLAVATLKHTHHDPELPDAEAAALAAAGAREVLAVSSRCFCLLHPIAGADEPGPAELATRFGAPDLLLVEGYKRFPHPKLELWEPFPEKPPLAESDPSVVALVTDSAVFGPAIPRFRRDDVESIASFIIEYFIRYKDQASGRPSQ